MKTNIEDLEVSIAKLLSDFGDLVYQATEDGLTVAEKILIDNLKAASPRSTKSGKKQKGFKHFADSWKSKGKKYKLRRYVGNTKIVTGGKRREMPLSNILEYGEKSPHKGFIKQTYYNSIDEMAAAVVAEIKKEV